MPHQATLGIKRISPTRVPARPREEQAWRQPMHKIRFGEMNDFGLGGRSIMRSLGRPGRQTFSIAAAAPQLAPQPVSFKYVLVTK